MTYGGGMGMVRFDFPNFPTMEGWTPQCIRSLEGGTCFDAVIRKQRGQTKSAHFCRRKNTCSTSLAKMILDHQMSVGTFSSICQEIATLGHKHGSFVKRRPCKRQSFGRLRRITFVTRFMMTQEQAFSLELCRNIEKKTWQAKKKLVLKFAKPRAPA